MQTTTDQTANRTHWRDLIVSDGDCQNWGRLGTLVDNDPDTLDNAALDMFEGEARIASWPGFYLSVPGEDADWDTPHGDVDWTGFYAALKTR